MNTFTRNIIENKTRVRILLADDDKSVLSALRLALEQQPHVVIVGEVGDTGRLMHWAIENTADLLVVDWELPGRDIKTVLPLLRNLNPGLKVIALNSRPQIVTEAMAAGADAFISKADPPEKLLEVLNIFCRSIFVAQQRSS